MSGFSTESLEGIFHIATYAAFILGGLSVTAALISAFSGYEVADRLTKESDLKIAKTNERAANAEQRAAEANQKAENERLLRVKLQQQLVPRRLTGSQREQLKKLLSKHPYNIGVVSSMLDSEGSDFADDFSSALKESNWFPVRVLNHIGKTTGLYVGTVEGTELDGTKILSHALDVIKIPHKVISIQKGDASIPSGFQSGVLYLIIESKPLPEPVK